VSANQPAGGETPIPLTAGTAKSPAIEIDLNEYDIAFAKEPS